MKTGERGLALIKEFEGCKLAAYQCPAGIWTIGIGSTHYGDGTPVTKNKTLPTEKAAIALLAATIGQFEKAVNAMGVELTQNEFDALVCLCYNIGAGNFLKSTLVKMLKAGDDKAEIAQQFLRWDKAGGKPLAGLTRRRNAEAELFLTP
ncbi:lysozyme [Chromatium okenii]|jgi:GH24 family phage-related lysozyme (muramidase)|uniref:lysozyme n=1 Tax=Chromatium okenii TaxID=61644 RepID=UPI0026E9B2F6|nr:lysozyme [Chromatium okenii]MBV5309270.1 lysozyme [Chromatium okenii]